MLRGKFHQGEIDAKAPRSLAPRLMTFELLLRQLVSKNVDFNLRPKRSFKARGLLVELRSWHVGAHVFIVLLSALRRPPQRLSTIWCLFLDFFQATRCKDATFAGPEAAVWRQIDCRENVPGKVP